MQSDSKEEEASCEAVYEFVRKVPSGKVVSYGQVAACVEGVSLTARQVGAAMRYPPTDVPWQRVVGADGHLPISKRSPELKIRQQHLLQQEGVVFHAGESDRVDMSRSQWHPAGTASVQGDLFSQE